jgi:glyoxylase-like metal-dependent hydrolase (beta-lactamase superfamily II)
MTLDGTNTWVLRALGAPGCVIVDPGPADDDHLRTLTEVGPVEAIMVTHWHHDHTAAVDPLRKLLGGTVPVVAASPDWCRDADPLRDGEVRALAGLSLTVATTPGHTTDSVCLIAGDDDGNRAVLAGDTILGRGTTVVAWPDGDLAAYLSTLDRLAALTGLPVLPGHGPALPDCGAIAAAYRAHRDERLDQVRAALAGGATTPAEVVAVVYPDLDPPLVPAAEWTVRAALAYLEPA